jgi:hypothetical protein
MTGRARELQDAIIERTAQKLEHVFGMAFHELPEKKGQYILVNKLFQTKEDTHIEMSPKVRYKPKCKSFLAHSFASYKLKAIIAYVCHKFC